MAKSNGTITIQTDRCKGCGLCIIACPVHLIEFLPNTVNKKGYQPVTVNDPEKCTGCANCAIMCPDSVITVQRTITKRRVEYV